MLNKLKIILGILFLFLCCYILRFDLGIALALSVFYIYLSAIKKSSSSKKYNILYLSLLYALMLLVIQFVYHQELSGLYLPFSLMPMLVTLLFSDLVVSFLFSVAVGISVAAVFGYNHTLGLLALVSGISSSLFVAQAHRRSTIISAGLLTGLVQMVSFYILNNFQWQPWFSYLVLFLNGIFSAALVLFFLLPFEYLFRVVTNISLLELSDSRNNPLLRKMILEAPGTYHHSLLVGNLAEAAAEAIGANALLARVGSYYHDIGKIEKAEYFVENQLGTHDSLAPSMSKLVVMNHVKEGVELARRYKLNQAIVDFISQHHGTSLVYFFYRRALENPEAYNEINEEIFRYPGPKPKSKETAIVLLADSVEAAARALQSPDHVSIEEVVHKIINNKFVDGQLDECELTLKNLETISKVFIRILASIYHTRLAYPEEKGGIKNNKSA